ncbi:hypothetical protein GCM10010384_23020 [Streptomyces djakartensis]|uniref:Uncharacterized protein n=1 Tax=Streptomyces djakartensis TaxID=68193 RepID=A0ABQ2ZIW1_9ACTN|nr:hypothetical protein GCM10010384_23020 [Streptomyces djakartensis]
MTPSSRVVQHMEGEPGRRLPVGGRLALPGQEQRPVHVRQRVAQCRRRVVEGEQGREAVVRDVTGHQQRAHPLRQLPQPVAHPLGALRRPRAPVQTQIADVRQYEHGRTPPHT